MKSIYLLLAVLSLSASSAFAQSTTSDAPSKAQSSAGASEMALPAPMTEGEVRKVNKEQGKITLRHGPIQNLSMPAMTMVFKSRDSLMLDKGEFSADQVNGALTVTAIEKK